MKSESLVIANQQVAVNTFPGLVHTARQTMKVTNTRSPIRRPKVGGMIGVKSEQGIRTGRCGWITSFLGSNDANLSSNHRLS